jgi:membrane protein implicated in regulation of membrane protease activity
MLLAALMAGAYVALLPQAPWWLSVVAWFVWMAGPVFAGTKMVKAYFRYPQFRIREPRGK